MGYLNINNSSHLVAMMRYVADGRTVQGKQLHIPGLAIGIDQSLSGRFRRERQGLRDLLRGEALVIGALNHFSS